MNFQICGHQTALTAIQLNTKTGETTGSLPDTRAHDMNDLRRRLTDA